MTAKPAPLAAPLTGRVTITRRVRFSAARAVTSRSLSETEHQALYGADRRLHGRDFTLWVTVAGPLPRESGMILDLKRLSALLRARIVEPLDRSVLEATGFLGHLPATTENLAVAVWKRLSTGLPEGGELQEVALMEGFDKLVRYRGE